MIRVQQRQRRRKQKRNSSLIFRIERTETFQFVFLLEMESDQRVSSHETGKEEMSCGHERSCPITDKKPEEQRRTTCAIDEWQIVGKGRFVHSFAETLSEREKIVTRAYPERDHSPNEAEIEAADDDVVQDCVKSEVPNYWSGYGLPKGDQDREC